MEKLPIIEQKLSLVPHQPGCYLMKNKEQILVVPVNYVWDYKGDIFDTFVKSYKTIYNYDGR